MRVAGKTIPYRLVVFDFDGTLADSFAWFLSVMDGVAERYSFRKVSEAESAALRSLGPRELLAELKVRRWKLPFIARHLRALKAADAAGIDLFPGVPDLLRALSEVGVTIAIVSSDSETNIRRVLGPDLARLVAAFDCGAALFGKRTHLARVLDRTGFGARAALCIGDEIRDAEAARAVGIAFGAVGWGFADPAALRARKPDHFFSRLDEVATLFGLSPAAAPRAAADRARAP